MDLKIKDIINCTNGTLIIGDEEQKCENYSIDTRTLKKGDTYIGIKGEIIDGCVFLEKAFEKGAAGAIINNVEIDEIKKEELKKQGKYIIKVEDTILALGKMAEFKRNNYEKNLKVVGVTGSVGKTSTKDIIANVLSKKYKVLKTQGNNNNNIGLPLTMLRLKDEEVAVIEMGMNHLGEISYLSKIAKPDISVITNIGTSHIGNLGSRENILRAKLEILDGMENKVIVINNDNDLLHKWNLEEKNNIEVHSFGINNKSEHLAENIISQETSCSFIYKNKEEQLKIKIPVLGEHFVLNALCAIAVGKLLNLDDKQLQEGLSDFSLTNKRMEIHHIKKNITIINDSYNASFESMKAAILSLKNMSGNRKIAILGDMFELGEFSEKLHRDVGKEVYKNNIDCLYVVGENSKYIADEAQMCGFNKENIRHFNNKEELYEFIISNMQEKDVILIKASNGMRLFDMAEKIIKDN